MQALILDCSPRRLELGQIAFIEAGITVTGSGSLAVAETCLKLGAVDVLVIDRRSAGTRFAEIVRLAELRNPALITITLTPEVEGDTDRLISAFPSVHAVLGAEVAPQVAVRMALASMGGQVSCAAIPQRRAQPASATEPTPETTMAPAATQAPVHEPAPQPTAEAEPTAMDLAREIAGELEQRGTEQPIPTEEPEGVFFSSRRTEPFAA
jgi:hypothetical protein